MRFVKHIHTHNFVCVCVLQIIYYFFLVYSILYLIVCRYNTNFFPNYLVDGKNIEKTLREVQQKAVLIIIMFNVDKQTLFFKRYSG